jgi:acetone carboxylase alpha subunit
VAPFVTPEPLVDYDIIVHPIGGAQAMGDPIERDPNSVQRDLDEGWTSVRVASDIHGVVTSKPNGRYVVDETATEAKRRQMREDRKRRAVPFKEWWQAERKKVETEENMDIAVRKMWEGSMRLSQGYGDEIRKFWDLPADFTFSIEE